MQKRHLVQLNAAIVAHCQWLESTGVKLGALPDVLTTVHLLSLMPGRAHIFPPGGFVRLLRAQQTRDRRPRRRHVWRISQRLREKKLFRNGAGAAAIQQLAGHADLATTQRYADLDANDLRSAIERIDGNGVETAPGEQYRKP